MKRPALYVLIPSCLGIAFAGIFGMPVIFPILSAAIFIFSSIIFSKNKNVAHTALFAAILFTGMAVYLNSNILPQGHISSFIPQDERNIVSIRGAVIDDPVMTSTSYGTVRTSFTLDARLLKGGASWRKVNGIVKADLFSRRPRPLAFGDEVLLEGTLSKPRGLKNPGLFNYAEYLGLKNIYCCFRVSEKGAIAVVGSGSLGSMKSAAYKIRHKALGLIDEYLTPPYSGFLKAIVIGDRSGLKDNVQDAFIKTGTVHVIAVSGLQVGLIAAIFLAIFGMLRIPRKAGVAVTAILLVFYAIISGSNPPIIRAVVMFAVYALGYLINRETDVLNSLSIAALAILLWNPKALYDPSFQLSFVSIAGTVIFTEKLNGIFARLVSVRDLPSAPARAYRYVTTSISVSIAAWLSSFPIVAAYFNIFSPVSIVANLIVIPMLFLLMAASFIFFAASFISAGAAAGIAHGLQFFEKALFAINGSLADAPLAYFRIGKPSFGFTILYYALVLLLIMPVKKTRLAMAGLLLLNMLVWPYAISAASNDLKVTFLDVGQGDSAFMEFPGGGKMLIDGGIGGKDDRSDSGESVIAPFLWNKRAGIIDILVVTHFHADHMGGILYILKNFKVRYVMDNGASAGEDSGEIYDEYIRTIREKGTERVVVREGDAIKISEDAMIFVLNPEDKKELSDSNDNSIVLKVDYKNFGLLFCGDIKDKAISRLITYGNFLKSDLVKVPHHGGDLGNAVLIENFFSLISPEISVISVGAGNKYRMPSGETINILTSLNTKRYITKDDGAIEISVGSERGRLKGKTAKEN